MPFNREERYDWKVDESFIFGFEEWILARPQVEDEIVDEALRPLGLLGHNVIDDEDMDAIRLELVLIGTIRYLSWKVVSAAGDWSNRFYVSLCQWNLAEDLIHLDLRTGSLGTHSGRLDHLINEAYLRRNLVRGSTIAPSEDILDDICTEALKANKRLRHEFLIAAYRDAVLLDPNWEREWKLKEGNQDG